MCLLNDLTEVMTPVKIDPKIEMFVLKNTYGTVLFTSIFASYCMSIRGQYNETSLDYSV